MSTASHSVEMLRAMSVARKTVASIRPFDPLVAQHTDAALERMSEELHAGEDAMITWQSTYPSLVESVAPAKRVLVLVMLKQIDQAFQDAADADSPL